MSATPGDGYGQFQGQPQDQGTAPPPADAGAAAGAPKKKKRGYAAGAFDVATGANAGVGGQMQGGAPPPAQYGGYPAPEAQQQQQQQPASGYQYGQTYDAQQPPATQPGYGGYPAPDQAAQVPGQGVAGITHGVAGVNINAQPQNSVPIAQARQAAINQLYPSDLLNQPFNVAEVDLAPPPINLPPHVSKWYHRMPLCILTRLAFKVQRDALRHGQLPSQVYSFDAEHRPHDQLPVEEV